MNVNTHINLLGMRCKDKVTGFTGVIASISFDLYGCIQAVVNPGITKEGILQDPKWFDVGRLEIISGSPVMDRPNFDNILVAKGKKGPAEKPALFKT